jgi:Tfp pilus assembly protein PilF
VSKDVSKAILAVILAAGVLGAQSTDSQELQKAISAHQKGEYGVAISGYEKFLKVHPEAAAVRSNLGAALAHEGRFEDAVREYTLALSVDPRNNRVRLNLALAHFKTGDIVAASKELEKVHIAEPENNQATLLLASCYLQMGDNKKVIAVLDPKAGSGGSDLTIPYLLGTALMRDNQTLRSQVYLDQILRNGDSAEARLMMGTVKMGANDVSGARADLQRAIELRPDLPGAHSYLGLVLLRAGDTNAATKAFRDELALNPNDFDANLQLGGLLRQEDKPEEARVYLKRSLMVRPGDFGARYQLAAIDVSEGRIEEARTGLESLIKEAPEFLEAHVSLATVYYRLKRKEDGDRERETVRKLNAAAQARQPKPAEANQ